MASPAAAASVRADLASGSTAGQLSPGVMTLRQAAEVMTRDVRPATYPLGPATRRALITEIASNADHRSSLGPLEELIDSPGLVDFLASRFRQLRRDGVEAEAAADTLRKTDGGRAGNVLADLYRDYLTALRRGGLIDDEGLVLQATEQASQGRWPLWRLLVDLPHPVSKIEHLLVEALAAHATERFAAGPSGGDNEDRIPAARQNTNWSKRLRLSESEVLRHVADAAPVAGLQTIQTGLFDDASDPSADCERVQVLAGSGRQDVARRVARRVKLMLSGGVRPSDVTLAAPNPESSAPRYAEALREYGVPLAIDSAPRLATAAATQAVIDLLEVADSDWSFDALTTLLRRSDLPGLGSRTIGGFASEQAAAEWFVRELQVPSGARYLRRQAEQIASRPEADDRLDRLREAARAAVGVFEALSHAVDALPEEATTLGWFDGLDTALRRLGHAGLTSGASQADRAAGDVIEEACSAIENLARWRGREPRALRRRQMLDTIQAWASRLRLPQRDSPEGRVRLLGATTASGIPCRHLFVIDADEAAFAPTTGDAEDAMLAFYELATTPTESLTFAYAALDDSAQPMLPSPYVTEVERLFAEDALRVGNEPLLATIDAERLPASPREWRQRAVLRALEGDAADLITHEATSNGALSAPLSAIAARAHGDSFGVWEGVLEGPAAQTRLGERYGEQHLWSASQLELMATCPFKFFARQALHLEEAGELTLGIDARRRGRLMHDALAECLTAIVESLPTGRTLRDIPPDELSQRLADQIDTLGDIGKLPPHEAALAAIEARQTHDWAERYADQQHRFHSDKRWDGLDRPLSPTLLEARFGPAKGEPDAAEDARSTDQPYEFQLPNGETLRLIGRIDRIDTSKEGDRTLFSVIDYKTSKNLRSKREHMESGKQLQPVLYAMAAQELFLEDAVPIAAGYWAVRKKGFVAPSDKELPLVTYDEEGCLQPSDEWSEVVDAVRQRCQTLVTDIRRGAFPMFNDDEHCGRSCEYRTICRVAQSRNLGKTPASAEQDSP